MAGTRKLERFELTAAPGAAPARARMISITTPVAEIATATLAAARRSIPPPPTVETQPEERFGAEEPRQALAPRSMDREPSIEQLRTRLARRFTSLADDVTERFAEFEIGAGAWRAELMAPEGMSTGGGKQALQHLRLRPKRQGHHMLVGGLVNSVTRTAELRDYDYMVALHHARFGAERDLGITNGEWEQFLRKTEVVLRAEGIASTRVPPPRELHLRARQGPGVNWRTIALVALLITAPLALLVGWRVLTVLLRAT